MHGPPYVPGRTYEMMRNEKPRPWLRARPLPVPTQRVLTAKARLMPGTQCATKPHCGLRALPLPILVARLERWRKEVGERGVEEQKVIGDSRFLALVFCLLAESPINVRSETNE